VKIIFWNYLFQANKRISHIQNLSGGCNLNLDDKIIAHGQTTILSAKNDVNMGNSFVDLTE
jgi:hypothetical protein